MTESYKTISNIKEFNLLSSEEKISTVKIEITAFVKNDSQINQNSFKVVLRDVFCNLNNEEYQNIYNFTREMAQNASNPKAAKNANQILNMLTFECISGKVINI